MVFTIDTDLGPVRIIQTVEDLDDIPIPSEIDAIYADVETTSFDSGVEAFFPYLGHRIAGFAFTWDDHRGAYYIPIRHTDKHWNLDPKPVMRWWQTVMNRSKRWRNHNIKFDAHFFLKDGVVYSGEWWCSLTEAKMFNSDRFTHQLKPLCRDWASLPMEEEDEIKAWLKGAKSKNYGDLPADICGKYAGMDVLGNRALCGFMDPRFEESLDLLRRQERALTPVLFDIEHEGLKCDRTRLKIEGILTINRLTNVATRITEIIGFEFTDSNKNLMTILCGQYSLPVLAYGRKKDDDGNFIRGNPTFDKDALKLYLHHEEVRKDPELLELVELIVLYRQESTFYSLFLAPYLELADENDYLHPSYNQVIRTGRMSSSNPNAMQLNKRAKALIIPPDGLAFLSADASQIEFRIIVHYIQDEEAIAAYEQDPRTDFHSYVAEMAETTRSEGKTLNFAQAFGAGKKKVTAELAASPGIAALVEAELGHSPDPDEFYRLCRLRASEVYDRYHARFPGIKETSAVAAQTARIRGYVFNLFGRRRHLPKNFARKAFNAIVQGSAADFVKSRMVALSPRYNDKMRRWGVRNVAQVHDELLFVGPPNVLRDPEFHAYLNGVLEEIPSEIDLSVPILWDMGYSECTWAIAAGDDIVLNEKTGVTEGRIIVAA